MKNRQHRAVANRIQEFVRVPARGERTSLGLAIADDAHGEEVGIVKHRAERVRERVAQFAAFVDGTRRFRRDVAGDAAGK